MLSLHAKDPPSATRWGPLPVSHKAHVCPHLDSSTHELHLQSNFPDLPFPTISHFACDGHWPWDSRACRQYSADWSHLLLSFPWQIQLDDAKRFCFSAIKSLLFTVGLQWDFKWIWRQHILTGLMLIWLVPSVQHWSSQTCEETDRTSN